MHKHLGKKLIGFILLGAVGSGFAADMSVQLNTTDGSTKFSIQNSAAVEVGSVDSQGNAIFTKVTESGAMKSFILNQNALQSGATFYVSSGTATNFNTTTLKFADGTTQTTASQGGTITGVTAGYGILGGGASGNVTVNLSPNATAYIQDTNSLQTGTTFYVSSGTATSFNTSTLKFADGTTQTTAGTLNGVTAGTGLTGGGTSGNVTLNLASNATAYIQNTNALQSNTTFYVTSGTVSGQFSAGNVLMPTGAHITVGSVQGTIVPSGTIILTTSTCPTGFTEYTGAGGFYLAGVPVGGTVGGTAGSAMTDLANTTHNHTVTSTTGMFGTNLAGNTNVVTSVTSPSGNVSRSAIAPYFQIRLCSVP